MLSEQTEYEIVDQGINKNEADIVVFGVDRSGEAADERNRQPQRGQGDQRQHRVSEECQKGRDQ